MSLHERILEPEIMDRGDLDAVRHEQALRGLARLNRLSGSTRLVWNGLRDLGRAARGRPLRILDVATGSADIPIGLWRASQRYGVPVELSACDRSDTALAHAERRVRAAGARIKLFPLDLGEGAVPGEYDIVVCSLFLHHLDNERAVRTLRSLAAVTRRRLLVNDLERGRVNLLLVRLASRLVTRSDVVHTDAVRSVRAAFTANELADVSARAGLAGAIVRRQPPCRLLLRWDAP